MAPRLPADSFVLVMPWPRWLNLRPGMLVKVYHLRFGYLVKRLDHIDSLGYLWLRGENDQSLTMEQMGPVERDHLCGVVCWTIKPD